MAGIADIKVNPQAGKTEGAKPDSLADYESFVASRREQAQMPKKPFSLADYVPGFLKGGDAVDPVTPVDTLQPEAPMAITRVPGGTVAESLQAQPVGNFDPMLSPKFVDDFRAELAQAPIENRLAALRAYADTDTSVYGRAAKVILADEEYKNAKVTEDGKREAMAMLPTLRPQPARFGTNAGRDASFPESTPNIIEKFDGVTPQQVAGANDLAMGIGSVREQLNPNRQPGQAGPGSLKEAKANEWRSVGQMASDTWVGLSQGVISTAQLPLNIVAPDSLLADSLRETQNGLSTQESEVMKAKHDVLRQRIDSEDGFLGKYAATVYSLVSDPGLGIQEAAKQIPNFIGVLGASKFASALAGGAVAVGGRLAPATLGLGEAISGGAIQSAAQVAGAGAGGLAASMVMAGGDAAGNTFERLIDPRQTPVSVWEKNPDYQKLIGAGKSSADAIREIATAKARMAALITAPLGVLGFMGAEASMVAQGLSRAGVRAAAPQGAAKIFAKEIFGEQAEEGLTQLGGNFATRTVDPTQRLSEGVAEAAGTAAVVSAPFAGTAAYGERSPAQPVMPSPRSQWLRQMTAMSDVADQVGISDKAMSAAMEKAKILPPDQVPGFLDRFTQSLARRGLAKPHATGEVDRIIRNAQAPVSASELLGTPEAANIPTDPLQPSAVVGAPSLAIDAAVPVATGPGADAALPDGASDVAVNQDFEQAAHQAATSPLNYRPDPTDKQKEAGNYAKGHASIGGIAVTIENPAGSTRQGIDPDGTPWKTQIHDHYGYAKRTKGADGEQIDGFFKVGTPSDYSGPVFVIDQIDPKTGKFDEHKFVVGSRTEADARATYQRNYEPGWNGIGAVTEMPMEQFKAWVRDGEKLQPVGNINPTGSQNVKNQQTTVIPAPTQASGKAPQAVAGNAATATGVPAAGSASLQAARLIPQSPSNEGGGVTKLAFTSELRPSGTLSVQGDFESVKRTLTAGGIDPKKITKSSAGAVVGASQAKQAQEILNKQTKAQQPQAPAAVVSPVAGVQNMVLRQENAANRFIDSAMEQFSLDKDTARAALDHMVKKKLVKLDSISGQFQLKDGRFWDGEALRNAAALNNATPALKPKKKPSGARNLRAAAYDKNPLMTFLATHGLFHDKTKPNSQKSEFSPDRSIMVMGYGPVFKKTGKQPSDLVVQAIEDGYLPQDGTADQLHDLIRRAIAGEKISPMYAEGVAEQIAQERIDAQPQYDDFLDAVQQDPMENDPFGPLDLEILDEVGFNEATPDIQDEFRAIIAHAESMGIDAETILMDVTDQVGSQATQQEYHEAAINALKAAITASSGNGNEVSGAQSPEAGPAETGQEGLASYTEADVRATMERAEQAQKQEIKDDGNAEARARDARIAKEIQQRQEASAKNFQLGQSAEDSLSGQGDIFDMDAEPVAESKPKEYRYAMVNRPVGISTIPKDGLIRTEERPAKGTAHYDMARNGVAVFNRELTDAETKQFEMALMADADQLAKYADVVTADMQEYAEQYAEISLNDRDEFVSKVAETLKRTAEGYPVSVGDMNAFADTVAGKLSKLTQKPEAPKFSRASQKGKSGVLSADGKFKAWPQKRNWTRAEYEDVVSLLPDGYRNYSHRREPLPTKEWNLLAAKVAPELEALNDLIGVPGAFLLDSLGNITTNHNKVPGDVIINEAKEIADKYDIGMYITNVKIPFMKPMMEKGFTSEIGISMVVQRAARDTIDAGTNWNKAAELNREVDKTPLRLETESIYRQIPGNVMSYKPRGFGQAMFSRAAPFYSELSRQLDKVLMKSGSAESWLQTLTALQNKGVKADEIEWSGVKEWMGLQSGKVTKEAVQDYLAANGVQVQEVELKQLGKWQVSDLYGETENFETEEEAQKAAVEWRMNQWTEMNLSEPTVTKEYGEWVVEDNLGFHKEFSHEDDAIEYADRYLEEKERENDESITVGEVDDDRRKGKTKYGPGGNLVLPGGTNYREVLLTLPEALIEETAFRKYQSELRSKYGSDEAILSHGSKEENAKLDALGEVIGDAHRKATPYTSQHWDQPNVLAHVRVNDRTDAEGGKVLFVEELQSDWSQTGRDRGFDAPMGQLPPNHTIKEETGSTGRVSWIVRDQQGESVGFGDTKEQAILDVPRKGIPLAPFVDKTDKWLTLALKRIIKMAVDESTPGNKAWNDATKPQSIREQVEHYLGRELAAVTPLEIVNAPVLASLKNDQIRRAVVEAIPVDVVNILTKNGINPESLLAQPDVVSKTLSIDHRSAVARGLASATNLVGARLRTALRSVLSGESARGDKELIPAVTASQLDPGIVVGLLSPARIYSGDQLHGDMSLPASGRTNGRAESTVSSLNNTRISGEPSTAELALFLNRHASIIDGKGNLVKTYIPSTGYEKIAFISGEQSADRYDLSKQIGRVEYTDTGVLVAVDTNGREVMRETVSEDKIEDHIGKEAARKLLEAKPVRDPGRGDINAKTRRIEGDGLKVGGEGMKTFYDQIVPNSVKALLKKLGGGQMEVVQIGRTHLGENIPQPGFQITDAMREKASGGLPLFSKRSQGATGAPSGQLPRLANQAPANALNATLSKHFKDDKHVYRSVSWGRGSVEGDVREAVRAAFGARIEFVQSANNEPLLFNGFNIPNQPKTLYVNVDGNVNFLSVSGHELWHAIKRQRPDLIEWYRENSRQYYKDVDAYQNRLNTQLQKGEKAYTADSAEEELEADFLGDSLTDADFLQTLADASPTKFKAFLDYVRMWLSGVVGKIKGLKSEREVKDVKALQGYLKDVLVAFADGKSLPAAPGDIAFNRGTTEPMTKFDNASGADQTETPAFRKWFGNSAVVDADGKPLVVYHGTRSDFNTFYPETEPSAFEDDRGLFFFTSSAKEASAYAVGDAQLAAQDGTPNVMPVFLSLINPKVVTVEGKRTDPTAYYDEHGYYLIPDAKQANHDGLVIENLDTGEKLFVAFKNTQVKSATGNNGDFDGMNPDIRFSRAPAALQPSKSPLDTILRKFGGTQLARITSPTYAWLARTIDSMTPEMIKAGLVADYGLRDGYLDRKQGMKTAQRQHARHLSDVIDGLNGLDRQQSRVAYFWMQASPDQAGEAALMAQLPEESRAALKAIKDQIDALGQEAINLGMISAETIERNRMAYLHRSYQRYEMEDGTAKVARTRTIKILGDQFKGRGMRDDADMGKIAALDWYKRKTQHGKSDTSLKGEMFHRLELRSTPDLQTQDMIGNDARKLGKLREIMYWPASEPIPRHLSDWRNDGIWEARFFDKIGKIGMWRDFTLDERTAMGEIQEVRYGVAKTIMQMSRDVETARFLDWVAKNEAVADESLLPDGAIAVESASNSMSRAYVKGEWVQVPNSAIPGTAGLKRFGNLAGRWVPGPVWNDIRQISNLNDQGVISKVYGPILRAWKISKTALSPATHMNNVMANFVMADAHDIQAKHLLQTMQVLAGYKTDQASKKMIELFKDNGGDGGMFNAEEIKTEIFAPLLKQLEEDLKKEGNSPSGLMMASNVVALLKAKEIRQAFATIGQTQTVKWASKPVQRLVKLYGQEDEFFRLAAFIKAKEDGLSDQAAGKFARESFLNYEINAPWIQAMRRSFMPFIAFTYRAAPMMAKIAADRPWKIAKYMMVAGGLNAFGYMMSGGDEDKERAFLPNEKAGKLWGVVPKLIRMPWNNTNKLKDGTTSNDPVFLDVRRWIPVGDIVDIGQSQSAIPIPPPLVPGGPAVLLGEVIGNVSLFTGNDITKETDTLFEKYAKVANHLWKGVMPNMPGLPGTYATTNLINAGKGKTDNYGREQSMTQAAASSFGIKLATYPIDVMVNNAAAKRNFEISEIKRGKRADARQFEKNGMTKEEFDQSMENANEKINKVAQEFDRKMGLADMRN